MAKKSKISKIQTCKHEKTEIRKMNSLRFNVCLNCGHKELIDEINDATVQKKSQPTLIKIKSPKPDSILGTVLREFPDGKHTMEELLVYFKPKLSDRGASSIRLVISELRIGSTKSKIINKHSCLKYDESTKKYSRME